MKLVFVPADDRLGTLSPFVYYLSVPNLGETDTAIFRAAVKQVVSGFSVNRIINEKSGNRYPLIHTSEYRVYVTAGKFTDKVEITFAVVGESFSAIFQCSWNGHIEVDLR